MSRSQKKQQAKRQQMIDQITKGTEVLLTSGIFGKVAEVEAQEMIVEIASGVKIKVAKSAIANVVVPEETENKTAENK
jgi:preprotein translocase subunit YajC